MCSWSISNYPTDVLHWNGYNKVFYYLSVYSSPFKIPFYLLPAGVIHHRLELLALHVLILHILCWNEFEFIL
jgi:hypothetical protein